MLDYLLESLSMEGTGKLFPHEQTIPEHLNKLESALKSSGKLIDSLIIDRKSKVILDGNHRKKVLEGLGYGLAVCQQVDYSSPEIRLGGWFPVVETSVEKVKSTFNAERVDFDTGMQEIQNFNGIFLAVKEKESYLIPSLEKNLKGVLNEQIGILNAIGTKGVKYIADDMAKDHEDKGVVFYRRMLQKKDVIEYASSGKLFPPKSTRHIVSRRIIRLEIPLPWLTLKDEEAQGLLKNLILERYNNNSIRYYAEPVILMKY